MDAVLELKPPLKWAGGKRWLVPALSEYWQPHSGRRLVEPFVGGMGVTLGLQPRMALLNDANEHLMNFYRHTKRGLVVATRFVNDSEAFYTNRERFNYLISHGQSESAEAAELFYYLNRTGFNGLCRFNNSGLFNVPFGRYKTINYLTDFSHYASQMRTWELIDGDFQELQVQAGDFVYADPPYDVAFTAYSKGGFGFDEQVRLAHWLAGLDVPVVASNHATERILDLYAQLGFELKVLDAPRRISCNGDRTPAKEVLATKGL